MLDNFISRKCELGVKLNIRNANVRRSIGYLEIARGKTGMHHHGCVMGHGLDLKVTQM